jgi:hypothetical protein
MLPAVWTPQVNLVASISTPVVVAAPRCSDNTTDIISSQKYNDKGIILVPVYSTENG